MKRAISMIVAAVALTGAILAPAAAGHVVKYDTTVTAKFKKAGKDGGTFSGAVDSTKPRCEANRTVEVKLRGTESDSTVGTDQTDLVGDWELVMTTDVAPGTYYAVAKRKVLRKKSGHRHLCSRVQTSDLTIK